MKIATGRCRQFVKDRVPFQCHGSLYACNQTAADGTQLYVVYSYGEHWPLFVCHDGQWYENTQRYSVTTSKHRSASHPHCHTVGATTDELRKFCLYGLTHCPRIERLAAVSV